MAIELQFLSLIIPKEKVEQYYPGGLAQYQIDNDKGFLEDDFLIREGAMGPYEIEWLIKKWNFYGLIPVVKENRIRKWKDMCVVDYLSGPTLPCDWLECRDGYAYYVNEKKEILKKTFSGINWISKKEHLYRRMPKGWNKTISDLERELEEGKRIFIPLTERHFAMQYERSMIPKGFRYPKKGDVYEAKFDQEVRFTIYYKVNLLNHGTANLLKGEQIWISYDPQDKAPLFVTAHPVNYRVFEPRILTEEKRAEWIYEGYDLNMDARVLNKNFILVQENFSKQPFE